jgi:hypothetical protein
MGRVDTGIPRSPALRIRHWFDKRLPTMDDDRRRCAMERRRRDLDDEERAALEALDDDLEIDGQLVADAAEDVSAGRALGEVATLDPLEAPLVEDELLADAFDELPVDEEDDLSGPDEDDAEAWVDEGGSN